MRGRQGLADPLLGLSLGWLVWCIIAWAAVTALSLLSVDVGAKFLGTLTSLEILSLLITGIAILAKGGPEPINFAASFDPNLIFAGGFAGTAGIALSFAFASFIGFESTAIYGEEAKDPKNTVRRATYLAVGVIAGLFTLVSFAMVTGLGSSTYIDQIDGILTRIGFSQAAPPQGIESLDQFIDRELENGKRLAGAVDLDYASRAVPWRSWPKMMSSACFITSSVRPVLAPGGSCTLASRYP